MKISRRTFVQSAAAAGIGLVTRGVEAQAAQSAPAGLARRFPDLHRHFVFSTYPWYAANPYRHWDEAGRRPPVDVASNYMPKLGAYDSGSVRVLEQHAKWIREAGAGAINVSWWGRDSDVDRRIPGLMDVMDGARHQGVVPPRTLSRPSRPRLCGRHRVSDPAIRRSPALGLLAAAAARGRCGRAGLQVLSDDRAGVGHRLPRPDRRRRRLRGRLGLAGADGPGPRTAGAAVRPRHVARRLARRASHPGRRIRRHRGLRQLRAPGELARARRSRAPTAISFFRSTSTRGSTASCGGRSSPAPAIRRRRSSR